jgi:hypothetical protein
MLLTIWLPGFCYGFAKTKTGLFWRADRPLACRHDFFNRLNDWRGNRCCNRRLKSKRRIYCAQFMINRIFRSIHANANRGRSKPFSSQAFQLFNVIFSPALFNHFLSAFPLISHIWRKSRNRQPDHTCTAPCPSA